MSVKPLLRLSLVAGILLGFAPGAFAEDSNASQDNSGPPACADGETLVYNNGVIVCGPACPAFVYVSFGLVGGEVFNVPASEIGDVHPASGDVGIPSGGTKNGIGCTFHLQCMQNGWVAITTGGDICKAMIQDVP
jgi:hypothetical protein